MKKAWLLFVLPVVLSLPGMALGQDPGGREIATEAPAGKIAVTTVSEEARRLYVEGRDLNEKLRAEDARPLLRQAIEADPDFATGHYGLAQAAGSNDEFFESLERAVALADGASEGERLMILALDAGTKGRADEQLEMYTQLVELFPEDERAHNLLGNVYNGRQEYDKAIAEYRKATEINPEFSPAYNSLGYAARAAGQFEIAEKAFQDYTRVLPEEANPYDSYAEFLMKRGRYDESIEQYRKALEIDPTFQASYVGVANDQILKGEFEAARGTMRELYDAAEDDNERRQSLFWTAASHLHEGNREAAIEALEQGFDIAEKNGDYLSMSEDYNLMGDIFLETGDPDRAAGFYQQSVEAVAKADVPEEVKEAGRRGEIYDGARVALAKDDLETAKSKAAEYHEVATGPFETRADHELAGRIALAEGRWDDAIAELGQANRQSPLVLFALAQAHHGKGDHEAMRRLATEAADFNQLSFPLAYVRDDAREMLAQ
ncbi:hypothetical protein BH18GEM1_BH18GEM1_22550 [soil metagenome]